MKVLRIFFLIKIHVLHFKNIYYFAFDKKHFRHENKWTLQSLFEFMDILVPCKNSFLLKWMIQDLVVCLEVLFIFLTLIIYIIRYGGYGFFVFCFLKSIYYKFKHVQPFIYMYKLKTCYKSYTVKSVSLNWHINKAISRAPNLQGCYESTPSAVIHFFPFPLEGLASNEGSMSLGSSPFTVNSLSARCCKVPPHFIPLSIRRDFSFSSPNNSKSAELL